MSTANVARDLDLLRRAVGDAKLTYAGYSYGSYLGATYANLFPGKVRALVVDGVLDPVAWSTGRGDQARTLPFSTRLRAAKGTYETLQEFLRLCDAGGPNCAFSEGNPARRFDRLAKRLLREPVEFPDGEGGTFLVTYNELIGATLGVLYDPASWPDWAVVLQQLWELTSPATAAASLNAVQARLGAGSSRRTTPTSSRASPGSPAPRPTTRRTSAPGRGRPGPRTASSPTSAGPGPGSPASASRGRAGTTTTTTAPGTAPPPTRCWWSAPLFDPATPYHGAVTVDRLLPRSRLLTLAGWGHTSLFVSACIDAHVSRYFLTTRVPAKGTVCEPDVVPFAEPAATAQALQATGASSKAALIPPMLRRMLTD